MAEDITEDLAAFNMFVADTAARETDAANRTELMNRFRSNIQIYLDAKQ